LCLFLCRIHCWVAARQQFFQQAGEGANFEALQGVGLLRIVRGEKRGGAEIGQQGSALSSVQDVVGVQVAVHQALGVQMAGD
jgi:hypothetical protein